MYPIFYPSEHINIPIYLIAMSLSFTLAIIYAYKRAIKLNLSAKVSTEISIAIMIGAFVGARVFHILFEYPEHYLNNPLEIFKFYKGGFVFYGGLLGGFITAYLYIKRIRQNFYYWLDCFALPISVGYMIGRIGCIFAGCCFGKECSLPWAIRFPEGVEAPANILLHPTQVYSILAELLIFLTLVFLENKKLKQFKAGSLFFAWLLLHGFARLVIEQFRGDFRGGTLFDLSISSYISLVLIIFTAIWFLFKKPN